MDIDTTPPSSHHDGRPTMQLDLPSADDVMMEVDPDVSVLSAPLMHSDTHTSSPFAQQSSPSAVASLAHAAPTRVSIDGGSSVIRPLPVPPVVLVSTSDSPAWPKFKLDQLFVEWLARSESRKWLDGVLEDARAGKPPEHLIAEHASRVSRFERVMSPSPARASSTASQSPPTVSPQQAPGSPVSRLFSNHAPFGYSDGSPRSPPSGPIGIASAFRPVLSGPAADFDLGRSGSASPLSKPLSSRELGPSAADKLVDKTEGYLKDRSSPSGTAEKSSASHGRAVDTRTAVVEKASSAVADRLVQVSDSKILDRVADGIAGMSAAVDSTPKAGASGELSGKEASVRQDKCERKQDGTGGPKDDNVVQPGRLQTTTDGVQNLEQSVMLSPHATDISVDAGKDASGKASVAESAKQNQSSTGGILAESDKGGELPTQGFAKDTDMMAVLDSSGGRVGDEVSVKKGQERVERSMRRASAGIPPPGGRLGKQSDMVMTDSLIPKKRKTLPRFYFPCGRDVEARERKEKEVIKEFFKAQLSQKNARGVNRTDIAELVVEVIGLPSYFAGIIFTAIQELFPGLASDSGPDNRAGGDNARARLGNAREESSMKDVGHNDEDMGVKPRNQGSGSLRDDSGATNSDTTMGDVNDAISEDGRVNGFTSASETAGAVNGSTVVQQSSGPSGESSSVPTPSRSDLVTEDQFIAYYNTFCQRFSKEARLFYALRDPKAKRDFLIPSDFKPLLRALLMCHQGLAFLHATPEFQQRYSETVIERIYFGCTRQHNGRLTLNDIKRSKLLDTLMVVDEEEDINRERKYFSYEHFYVLYCRFWELDANHDLQIDREDLMRYGSHSLTYRIVDRIFGGYARPLDCPENPGYMSYTDFIWFCLSEEDKTSDTAIDYWFRCVDMDGDGLITMYDMEFFYKEQLHRMECFGHEPVQIRDILCQLLDMIKPNVKPPVIRRRDLRRCRLASNFFNVLFNLNKFFAIEARDPLQIRQEHATPELTDWDRFAALEYLRLSAEEEGEEDESWEDVGDATNPLMAGEAPF